MLNIKKFRLESGLSQKELASQLGIAPNTFNQYEKNKREPDLQTLQVIANFFHVTINELMDNQIDTENEQKNKPTIPEDDELANENIELFKKLPDDKKQQALDYLRYLVEHQGKE